MGGLRTVNLNSLLLPPKSMGWGWNPRTSVRGGRQLAVQELQDRGRGLHPRIEHVEALHLSRGTLLARTLPGVLRPRRVDKLRTLDQAAHLERGSLRVVQVVLAAADDQCRHLDVVEHLVLDTGDRLTWFRHEGVEPAQHQLEKLVGVLA